MTRSNPLNAGQLEVLAWVRDGADPGTYEGYEHRIVARALHNRGLIVVAGHGRLWRAELTDEGSYYLEHGEYPAEVKSPPPAVAPAKKSEQRGPVPKKPARKPRAPAARRPGPTDAMIAALIASPDHRIDIAPGWDERRRYEQLVRAAERFKKAPEGMQVTLVSSYRDGKAYVELAPMPEWRTRALDPVPVPGSLRGASEVVKRIQAREDLDIRGPSKNRALRLLQALVAEAESRGHEARFVKPPPKDRWGYVQKHDRNQGHLMLVLGPDDYRLSVVQITKNVAHVLSKAEAKRAEQGHWVQKWDTVPTERLLVRIETHGPSFWGSEWKDAAERPLEDALAQVLQELELRHAAAEDRREAEERARVERNRQWSIAREEAVVALTESHRAERLAKQVKKWRAAAEIREYADAVEQRAADEQDAGARRDALEWAEWARGHADRIDPLLRRLRLPEPPEATEKALQPFMGKWSAYGPETSYRG